MDTNGKVITRFFANPQSYEMVEGEVGFDKELSDASQGEDFWSDIELVFGLAYERFRVRLDLLTNKLSMALALRSQGALLDTPIINILSPDHPSGPKSEKALKNVMTQKRNSLCRQHSRNNTDSGERASDLEELRQFEANLMQRLLKKEIASLWQELQERSEKLRSVALVINKYTVAGLPDPVVLLHESVANPTIEFPSFYTPPELEEGATSPLVDLSDVMIYTILSDDSNQDGQGVASELS